MENITFTQKDGVYVADFESKGKCVIQVDNGTADELLVYRYMPSMEPSAYDRLKVREFSRIIELDVPAGMMIRIVSKRITEIVRILYNQVFLFKTFFLRIILVHSVYTILLGFCLRAGRAGFAGI